MSSLPHLPLLARLDAHDRALMSRFVLDGSQPRVRCRMWLVATHLGGARVSIMMTLSLLALPSVDIAFFYRAALNLICSHLAVRFVKQRAERARPGVTMALQALVVTPDKFSFPSGHSSAALSVALAYAVAFPAFGPLIVLLAFLVGTSRVALGVHYPGDVLAGQLISGVVACLCFA
ncbi:MAG: phosphatase PAP2 family protein [Gemmatimonas sp.]